MDKHSKTVLISGASTGIGKACAERLGSLGHTVYAGVRKDDISFESKNVKAVQLDVCNSEQIKSVLQNIPQLDVVMNNAGIAVGGPLECVSLEEFKKQFDVNVVGVFDLTRQALALLKKSKTPLILNTSSVSGLFASPYIGPYAASKFAVEALSDAWRRELRKFNIPVVLLEPGPIKTPIWDKSINQSQLLTNHPAIQEYEPEVSNFMAYVEKEGEKAVSVDQVADLVQSIIEAQKPKARYIINGSRVKLKTLSLLPESWGDSLLEKGIASRR